MISVKRCWTSHTKTQVVAGTVFMVKATTNDDEYVHLKILRPLPHKNEPPRLMGEPEFNKSLEDPL